MKCPYCKSKETHVLESRACEDGSEIRRRRECEKCNKRFTTYERLKNISLWVIKKDGRRDPFDREKIKKGILRALEKRPVSINIVDDVVDIIERKMLSREKQEVSSQEIGKEVLTQLSKVDKVAWLRFASVYLEFDDLKDFDKAIRH